MADYDDRIKVTPQGPEPFGGAFQPQQGPAPLIQQMLDMGIDPFQQPTPPQQPQPLQQPQSLWGQAWDMVSKPDQNMQGPATGMPIADFWAGQNPDPLMFSQGPRAQAGLPQQPTGAPPPMQGGNPLLQPTPAPLGQSPQTQMPLQTQPGPPGIQPGMDMYGGGLLDLLQPQQGGNAEEPMVEGGFTDGVWAGATKQGLETSEREEGPIGPWRRMAKFFKDQDPRAVARAAAIFSSSFLNPQNAVNAVQQYNAQEGAMDRQQMQQQGANQRQQAGQRGKRSSSFVDRIAGEAQKYGFYLPPEMFGDDPAMNREIASRLQVDMNDMRQADKLIAQINRNKQLLENDPEMASLNSGIEWAESFRDEMLRKYADPSYEALTNVDKQGSIQIAQDFLQNAARALAIRRAGGDATEEMNKVNQLWAYIRNAGGGMNEYGEMLDPNAADMITTQPSQDEMQSELQGNLDAFGYNF